MLKDKLIILFLVVLSLTVVSVNSLPLESDISVTLNATNSVIFEDEVAEYDLFIRNNATFEETFVAPYTSDADWIITADPAVTKIAPKTTQKYKLYVDPKTTVSPGQYGVTLNVKSLLTDDIVKSLFLIFVKPLNPLPQGYRASIALNVEMPTEIDPRSQVPISIYLRNRNAKEFDNLTILLTSKLINKNETDKFSALEEKTEKFIFKLSSYETPQQDQLIVNLIDGEEIVNTVKVPFRIIPYSEIKEQKTITDKFLKKVTKITIKNEGNIRNVDPYQYDIGFFENIVTKTTPDSIMVKDDKRHLSFSVSLDPGQSTTFTITTNYRYVLYTILLIIAFIIMYYQFRSSVISRREVITNEPAHDGVSEFKVRLIIRNRSQKPVENCKIIESVPSLASLIKESTLGTIEPTKIIKHDKRGTIIRWDINYLEPLEERIITYKIKSKLNIVGSLTLPETKIKYENVRGTERVTYSPKHKIKIY